MLALTKILRHKREDCRDTKGGVLDRSLQLGLANTGIDPLREVFLAPC